jgi:hypothetical protein
MAAELQLEHAQYPPALELKQLILIHRHGERTPIKEAFKDQLPVPWKQCSLQPFVRALHTVLDQEGPEPIPPHLQPHNIQEIRIVQGDQLDHPLLVFFISLDLKP